MSAGLNTINTVNNRRRRGGEVSRLLLEEAVGYRCPSNTSKYLIVVLTKIKDFIKV
jgi:hypothetical protein